LAGFFGWKTAGEIHRRIRTPQREHFANANLSEADFGKLCFGMIFTTLVYLSFESRGIPGC
jgi:hypothetical protein